MISALAPPITLRTPRQSGLVMYALSEAFDLLHSVAKSSSAALVRVAEAASAAAPTPRITRRRVRNVMRDSFLGSFGLGLVRRLSPPARPASADACTRDNP